MHKSIKTCYVRLGMWVQMNPILSILTHLAAILSHKWFMLNIYKSSSPWGDDEGDGVIQMSPGNGNVSDGPQ